MGFLPMDTEEGCVPVGGFGRLTGMAGRGNLKTLGQPAQISLSGKFPFFGRFFGRGSLFCNELSWVSFVTHFWNKNGYRAIGCGRAFRV
jgi:hypothetical protein